MREQTLSASLVDFKWNKKLGWAGPGQRLVSLQAGSLLEASQGDIHSLQEFTPTRVGLSVSQADHQENSHILEAI